MALREALEKNFAMMWMPLMWLHHMCDAHCNFLDELSAASEVTRRRAMLRVVN